jgi:hypothetical protein|tara:strand:- start:152 stop:301 length:150 start_codon:yes stop_codon:yes gene_type:complete
MLWQWIEWVCHACGHRVEPVTPPEPTKLRPNVPVDSKAGKGVAYVTKPK